MCGFCIHTDLPSRDDFGADPSFEVMKPLDPAFANYRGDVNYGIYTDYTDNFIEFMVVSGQINQHLLPQ